MQFASVTLLCLFIFMAVIGELCCLPSSLRKMPGTHILVEPTRVCRKSRRLRGKPGEICRTEPVTIDEMTIGAKKALEECRFQFRNRKWNCTDTKSLKKVLHKDTRETGFVNSIISAGLTAAVTGACSSGKLMECSCDKSKESHGDWHWNGCQSDNVDFGYKKCQHFLDARYRKRSDIRTLVLLHNYEAGRLAVKNHRRRLCKCHGMSGSCTMETCWMKIPTFREIGMRLKERFDGAVKVIPNNDGQTFTQEHETIKAPSKEDIIYTENSQDFCLPNRKTGSLGTHGRVCNISSMGVDGCDLLCCGRHFEEHRVKENVPCSCRFQWCCNVNCKTCEAIRVYHTCR